MSSQRTDRPERLAGLTGVDLSGTRVLVTGGTDGIGERLVYALVRLGADVVFTGRDRRKGTAVADHARSVGSGTVEGLYADFADLDAVRSLGADLRDGRLDVLVHNAGGIFREGTLTDAGTEKTVTVNYLAPFVLTHELTGPLRESGEGRVVSVTSNGHRFAEFDLGAFETVEDYSAFGQYNLSKLALLMFSFSLDRRVPGLDAVALHPGFVPGSAFYRDFPRPVRAALGLLRFVPRWLIRRPVVTESRAAASVLNLCANPDLRGCSGEYFELFEPTSPSSESRDRSNQTALWARSKALAGIETFD